MQIEKLIEDCKNQDRKAQQQLYKLFGSKIYSICLRYSKNKADAEDSLQDSFLTIFDKIGRYKHKGSFEGWMCRIAINTVLQKFRKERVFDLISDEVEEDTEVIIEGSHLDINYLLKLIQKLPDRYQAVFNLYVIDGFSHKEIAEKLNISEGTSKSNLSRARMILKNTIEKDLTNKKTESL
ncbi:sigma-70 family RNA polymerase sigma factor [Leptobacterium sp. I13]|uniref:RNA polymerase sigma factor n=1 Tax=Leptobacterium meishanense TaxID=3128904 RepID=UPI0030EF31FF